MERLSPKRKVTLPSRKDSRCKINHMVKKPSVK